MDEPGNDEDWTLHLARSVGAVVLSMLLFVCMDACSIMIIGNTPQPDTGQVAASVIAACVWSIVAGAVAAAIAGRGRILHALVAGLLLAGFAIYLAVDDPSFQHGYKVGLAIAVVPGFLLGAFAWTRRPGPVE